MAECTFNGCNRPRSSFGLCQSHRYQQNKGKPLTPVEHRYPVGMSPEDKFWLFTVKSPSGCLIWQGSRTRHGYGQYTIHGRGTVRAHRYAWELLRGPIPDGYVVDHDHPDRGCHNPSCVNPDHLDAVPPRTNVQRRRGATRRSKTGERGVFWSEKFQHWRGEIKYTDEHGVQRSITKASKDRAVVSAWVIEMRQQYHD